MSEKREVVDCLWSGGWDSTFRVLELTLIQGERVQPHYLLDSARRSTPQELEAIERIRTATNQRVGFEAIAEPLTTRVDDISISPEAERHLRELVACYGIGPQYLALSEYARQTGLTELELSVHIDDRAWPIAARLQGEPIPPNAQYLHLFERFRFPLLNRTKTDMLEHARAGGFDDLMELTWFCHIPTQRGAPCGFCNPCRWTIEEGLGNRLTRSAHLRGWADKLVRNLPSYRIRTTVRYLLRRLS